MVTHFKALVREKWKLMARVIRRIFFPSFLSNYVAFKVTFYYIYNDWYSICSSYSLVMQCISSVNHVHKLKLHVEQKAVNICKFQE